MASHRTGPKTDEEWLTPLARRVLDKVKAGRIHYDQIAEELNISVNSVRYAMRQISHRLGMTAREYALAHAGHSDSRSAKGKTQVLLYSRIIIEVLQEAIESILSGITINPRRTSGLMTNRICRKSEGSLKNYAI